MSWLAALAASSAVLLLPAIYNGFPLLFPDSLTYLKIAYGQFWTLDRASFYGLLAKPILLPTAGVAGLWSTVALQAVVVSTILIFTIKRLAPASTPGSAFLLVLLSAAATSLPWHVAQLMPDAFTGALVLLAWLATTRDVGQRGSPLLWLAVCVLTLVHYTHLVILAAAVGITLAFSRAGGVALGEIGKRALAALLVAVAVLTANAGANGLLFQRWSPAPMSGWFLFARVHEDGLADDWLDRHCGRDAPRPLCAIRGRLPRDSQQFLWSRNSPLYPDLQGQIASPVYWQWTDMVTVAAWGAIREEPGRFIENSAVAAAKQFVTFAAVDDQCPEVCAVDSLIDFRPDAARSVQSSRQLRGMIAKAAVRAVTGTVEALALLLLIPFFIAARRRGDRQAQALLATITGCLLANALVTGALSDVQPRYQSRLVWLAVFVEIVLIWRWLDRRAIRRRPDLTPSATRPAAAA